MKLFFEMTYYKNTIFNTTDFFSAVEVINTLYIENVFNTKKTIMVLIKT